MLLFFIYFNEVSIYTQFFFFFKYNVLLFVLFKRDMIVNLFKLYFQSNKKNFYPYTFPPFQPNTNEGN